LENTIYHFIYKLLIIALVIVEVAYDTRNIIKAIFGYAYTPLH